MNRLWIDFANIVAAAAVADPAADPESVLSAKREKTGRATKRIAAGSVTAAIKEAVTQNDRPKLQS